MIGTALGVCSADLDSLKENNNPVEVNLAKIIGKWLDECGEKATWEILLKAVEGKIVNSKQTG